MIVIGPTASNKPRLDSAGRVVRGPTPSGTVEHRGIELHYVVRGGETDAQARERVLRDLETGDLPMC